MLTPLMSGQRRKLTLANPPWPEVPPIAGGALTTLRDYRFASAGFGYRPWTLVMATRHAAELEPERGSRLRLARRRKIRQTGYPRQWSFHPGGDGAQRCGGSGVGVSVCSKGQQLRT